MALSANTKTIIVNEKGMASLFIVLSMVGLLTMVLLAQSGFGNSLNLQSLEKFQEDKSRLKKEISLVLGTISSCRNAMTHAGVAVFNSNESMVLRNPQQELIAAPNMHYSTVHIARVRMEQIKQIPGLPNSYRAQLALDVYPGHYGVDLTKLSDFSDAYRIELPLFFVLNASGRLKDCTVSENIDDSRYPPKNDVVQEDDICFKMKGPGYFYDPSIHRCSQTI